MLGRKAIFICCLLWCLFSSNALATIISIDHLAIPAVYDNVGGGWSFGQTFIAQDVFISGFQVYIGDPTRPGDSSVNELIGRADLALYNATDLLTPFEVARRDSVVPSGTIVNGLSTFLFDTPVPVENGTKYFFIIISPGDNYGIGLRAQYNSTYADGAEAFIDLTTMQIFEHPLARDLSFAVLSPEPVPEPSTMLLLGSGLLGVIGFRRFKK